MKKYFLVLTTVALLSAAFAASTSPQDTDDVRTDQVKQFMRVKLEHAKGVLEGVTLEDYDGIARNAQRLSLLSLESNWQVLQTPKYVEQSAEFRRAADALTAAAKNRNLDGATIAYLELTLKCVQCHKYVRSARMP